MNKLKRYKFSDLYDISSGISSKKKQAGHGAPFLSFSSVFNNHFIPEELDEKMDTSEKEQKKYSIKEGDIFLTRTSETLDELGMSSVALNDYPEATYSGFLKRLRPKQSDVTYHKYLAFYLRGYLFRKSMNYKAVMTLRASLNEKIFSYLDLLLPEYSQQKKIGDFLFLIEEKIELNKKLNEELESMAKLVYDYWFVQFDFPDENGEPYKSSGGEMFYDKKLKKNIPKGWQVRKLSEVCTRIQSGGTPTSTNAEYYDGDINWYTTKELDDNQLYQSENKITIEALKESSAKLFPKGTVAIAIYASPTVGRLGILMNEGSFNQACCGLVVDKKFLTKEYLFLTLQSYRKKLNILANGTTQKNLSVGKIKEQFILVPKEEIIQRFDEIVNLLFNRIENSVIEIQKLYHLRNWLLPMLMNGQVTVKEADEELSIAAEPDTEYKVTKKPTNVDYYRRTVLAAEIVWQLHQQPTLGHVKLQKIIYLAKQTSSMMLPTNFLKQAAGPYDPQMARSIDKQLKKNKWFEFQKDEFLKYKPLEKAGKHKADFDKYFHEEKENIQFFIDTFKKAKTAKVEIIASLYACWKELIEKGKTVTDDILIEQFYNWSEEKSKFKQDRLLKAINWMRDEGVYPVS